MKNVKKVKNEKNKIKIKVKDYINNIVKMMQILAILFSSLLTYFSVSNVYAANRNLTQNISVKAYNGYYDGKSHGLEFF